MNIIKLGLFFIAFSLCSCQPAQQKPMPKNPMPTDHGERKHSFISALESAHQKELFTARKAINFDLKIKFGGKERLDARVTLSTDSGKGMLKLKDGNTIYFDDEKVFHSPEMENTTKVRFDAYTWSYFFLFPYKLNDQGVKWSAYPDKKLNEVTYNTKQLRFEKGVGDAPDDWYIVYADETSQLIKVLAYIVSAGKTLQEAEADPHAIEYKSYEKIAGIPIATEWFFWEWRAEKGLTKILGEASLENISFVDQVDILNSIPSNFISI